MEGLSATAGALRVGIVDLEAPARHCIAEINDGPSDVVGAEGIHKDLDSEEIGGQVVVATFVKGHAILHSGTSPRLHEYTQVFPGVIRIGRKHS